jgi:nitrate reductase gamma subunit
MKQQLKQQSSIQATIVVTLIALLIVTGFLAMSMTSPFEITRIRNSLLASAGSDQDFAWQPGSPPPDYLLESKPPPPEFVAIETDLFSGMKPSLGTWEKAQMIAQHLSKGPGIGSGIMSNTYDTYRTIMTDERGYCADYTQVFNAIAIAAGIPVREWGVSFDGFSGDGHAFNEIYDDDLQKWVFIDSFYSLYVKDARTGERLSALEFQSRLRRDNPHELISVKPISHKRFAFKDGYQVVEYYRRGADQFYLWFGNNVYSYDDNWLVKLLGPYSRAVEQGVAILTGLHPKIRIVPTSQNAALISELAATRFWFFVQATALGILAVALAVELVLYRRTQKQD